MSSLSFGLFTHTCVAASIFGYSDDDEIWGGREGVEGTNSIDVIRREEMLYKGWRKEGWSKGGERNHHLPFMKISHFSTPP